MSKQFVYKREHVAIAERVLGHPLPYRAVVHHVNGDPTDNSLGNLVICEDQGYHSILHRRARALKATGHADWLRCRHCGVYDDPAKMHVFVRNGRSRAGRQVLAYHATCNAEARRKYHPDKRRLL